MKRFILLFLCIFVSFYAYSQSTLSYDKLVGSWQATKTETAKDDKSSKSMSVKMTEVIKLGSNKSFTHNSDVHFVLTMEKSTKKVHFKMGYSGTCVLDNKELIVTPNADSFKLEIIESNIPKLITNIMLKSFNKEVKKELKNKLRYIVSETDKGLILADSDDKSLVYNKSK